MHRQTIYDEGASVPRVGRILRDKSVDFGDDGVPGIGSFASPGPLRS